MLESSARAGQRFGDPAPSPRDAPPDALLVVVGAGFVLPLTLDDCRDRPPTRSPTEESR